MDMDIVYLCAGCGEKEAEKEESLCSDCIQKIRCFQLSWTKEAMVGKNTSETHTGLGDSYGTNNTAGFERNDGCVG